LKLFSIALAFGEQNSLRIALGHEMLALKRSAKAHELRDGYGFPDAYQFEQEALVGMLCCLHIRIPFDDAFRSGSTKYCVDHGQSGAPYQNARFCEEYSFATKICSHWYAEPR
jgi:hypothetical protein